MPSPRSKMGRLHFEDVTIELARFYYSAHEAALKLDEHDHIVAVVAEPASGPGWANTPLWIIVQDGNGKLRRECLQPDEQSDGIRVLYATAAAVHGALVREVEALPRKHAPTRRKR